MVETLAKPFKKILTCLLYVYKVMQIMIEYAVINYIKGHLSNLTSTIPMINIYMFSTIRMHDDYTNI